MTRHSRRFSERLREAKQLLNAIDPALTDQLREAVRVKIVRVAQKNPNEPEGLSQETVKNLVYAIMLKRFFGKDNLAVNNNPNHKPRYWIRRCNWMNAQAAKLGESCSEESSSEEQKNLPQEEA